MILYFGIDVHTTTFTVTVAQPPLPGDASNELIFLESREILPFASAVDSMVTEYKNRYPDMTVLIGYEAGCLGTSLYRELKLLGHHCVILAPTTMPSSPSDRHKKNDKRDSRTISRCLFHNTYSAVYVNSEMNEAVSNFIRARDDAQERVKVIKQQVIAYCHRCGHHFESKSYWTAKHYAWLKELKFDVPLGREVLDHRLKELQDAIDCVEEYDKRIAELAEEQEYAASVGKINCFLGMSTNRAMALVAEIGDYSRFKNADGFVSYLGLCPGQHDSGESTHSLPITKAGNCHLRKILVEAAQSICKGKVGHKSKELKRRQNGQALDVIAYADKGNTRFRKKYYRMIMQGKCRNVAVTAIARELACFIWGMMNDKFGIAGVPKEGAAA